MENNEISSKIVKIENDFLEFRDINDKRINFLEEKFSNNLRSLDVSEVSSMASLDTKNENKDFIDFLRTGEIHNSYNFPEFKSSGKNNISIAGCSYQLIDSYLHKFSALRRVCNVQVISYDSFDVIIEEGRYEATWGNESSEKSCTKKYIKVHDIICQPKATMKLIEDVKIDIETYMVERIAESFAITEDKAFLSGTGTDMPKGILTYQDGSSMQSIQRIEGKIDTDSILKLIDSLDIFYNNEVAFLMSKETENLIKSLKDSREQYIWLHRTSEEACNTILGIPVFTSNFMPKPVAGNVAIIYGNFRKGYQIVDKSGYSMMRDPYTAKPFVKFYTAKRTGGDVVDGRSLKFLKIK